MTAAAPCVGARGLAPAGAGGRLLRALALAASLAFGLAWTLLPGKAFHWDAINYHFYLGFAALHERTALDFFAAGTPSYINPYAYVPLHLLSAAQVPGLAVAVIFALVHSLVLWLTYELALVVIGPADARERQSFAFLALLLALLSPVLLHAFGLTLVDVPLGALVVAGWIGCAIAVRDGAPRWALLGGLACGVAAALKLSNVLFAMAAFTMLAFIPGGGGRKLSAALAFAAACGASFAVLAGPWAAMLWREFGNPVFPFLNHVFASPDFTTAPLNYERFHPANLREFLLRPFAMLLPDSNIHVEGRAPDLRFAALAVALAIALGVAALRRNGREPRTDASPRTGNVLAAVSVAFVVAWVLWLQASGNSRYFIGMACVGAALLAALLQRGYRKWPDATRVAIAVLVLVQAGQMAMATEWRREGMSWAGPLLEVRSPQRFRDEPHFFLSASFMSASALLPHWHPASGMANISGFYSLGPDRPGWSRLRALLERNRGRLRVISHLPPGVDATTGLPGPPSDLDVYVERFGLAVDPTDCEFVQVKSNLHGSRRDRVGGQWTNWVTCRLREAPEVGARFARDVRVPDAVFDRVEAACPNLFHPPRPVTEKHPQWTRLYNMGSELQLWIEGDRVKYFSPVIGGDAIDIGTVDAWLREQLVIDCSRKSAPAFGLRP